MGGFIVLAILMLVFVCAVNVFLTRLELQQQKGLIARSYQKTSALFTDAEREFLSVLEQAFDQKLKIFGKVRLADIVQVKTGLGRCRWQQAFNKIQSKHVDFVVCDPVDLSILGVVELDDSTHRQSHRKARDEFVDQVLAAAEIPIVHFPVRKSYDPDEIRNAILKAEGKKGRM